MVPPTGDMLLPEKLLMNMNMTTVQNIVMLGTDLNFMWLGSNTIMHALTSDIRIYCA